MGQPIRTDAWRRGFIAAAGASVIAASSAALASSGCVSAGSAPVGSSPPRAPDRARGEGDAAAEATAPGSPSNPPSATSLGGPLTRVTNRFTSRGHGERFDAVVWVNAAALAAINDHRAWPDGAVLVEQTAVARAGEGADAGDRATGVLSMEKRPDGWQFSAIQPDGDVVRDARIAPCAACHRDASDFVFPLPR